MYLICALQYTLVYTNETLWSIYVGVVLMCMWGNWSDQTKQQRTTQKEEECMVKYANNAICAQKQKMTDYKILR